MMDDLLSASLDDQWRSPQSVKRLIGSTVQPELISVALRRLAKAGKIDKQEQTLGIRRLVYGRRRHLGPPRVIELYRKSTPADETSQ